MLITDTEGAADVDGRDAPAACGPASGGRSTEVRSAEPDLPPGSGGVGAALAVTGLLAIDEDDWLRSEEFRHLYGRFSYDSGPRRAGRRLYTATLASTRDDVMTQAFHASVARDRTEIFDRLVVRFGAALAREADIRVGLDQAAPLVIALVPAGVADVIRTIQLSPASPDARTFAVDIQQTIRA